jgi:hypothetical protein
LRDLEIPRSGYHQLTTKEGTPMPPATESGHEKPANGGGTEDGDASAMLTIADGLTAEGFDVRSPALDGSSYMKITSVWGMRCELTITDSGIMTWESRSRQGSNTDPARVMALAAEFIGARTDNPSPSSRYSDLTLKGAVGQMLVEHGIQVTLQVLGTDQTCFEVYAEVEATNPLQPTRGIVRVADDGGIWWECRVAIPGTPSQVPGLELTEVTRTIASALQRPAARTPAAAGPGEYALRRLAEDNII